mgnify:FL=1
MYYLCKYFNTDKFPHKKASIFTVRSFFMGKFLLQIGEGSGRFSYYNIRI